MFNHLVGLCSYMHFYFGKMIMPLILSWILCATKGIKIKTNESKKKAKENVAIVLLLDLCQMRWAAAGAVVAVCMFIKPTQFIWECAFSIAFVLRLIHLGWNNCYTRTLFLTHCRPWFPFSCTLLPQKKREENHHIVCKCIMH